MMSVESAEINYVPNVFRTRRPKPAREVEEGQSGKGFEGVAESVDSFDKFVYFRVNVLERRILHVCSSDET